MIIFRGFRNADARFPLLREFRQPSARWHQAGEGPVAYFFETPRADLLPRVRPLR